jgi:hypothetical protein
MVWAAAARGEPWRRAARRAAADPAGCKNLILESDVPMTLVDGDWTATANRAETNASVATSTDTGCSSSSAKVAIRPVLSETKTGI